MFFATKDFRSGFLQLQRFFSALWRAYYEVLPKYVYIDNVRVFFTGTTKEDLSAILTDVLCRMSFVKCDWNERNGRSCSARCFTSDTLCRAKECSTGIQPMQDKIRAIRDAPAPTDLHQLKSFLGLLNFYAKFQPNLFAVLARVYSLLQKNQPWSWGPKQQRVFHRAKQLLTSASLLIHYSNQH